MLHSADAPRLRLAAFCNTSCYSFHVDIAHKGLLAFFERGDSRRIPAALAPRIRRILSDLDAAVQPADMNLPGYHLHPLKGVRFGTGKGCSSILGNKGAVADV